MGINHQTKSYKMEQTPYQKIMREVRQCQERSQKTLSSIDSTLSGVRQTLKDIEETNHNIDKLKDDYNTVMQKLTQKIAKSFTQMDQPFKKRQGVAYEHLPTQISEHSLAQKILHHSEILIVTGAGVSADSGIPTFRGKGGLYSNGFVSKEKSYTPQEFITFKMFSQSPQDIWKWIDSIYHMSTISKPNQNHLQIDLLAKTLSKMGKKITLATQNIDDLHIKPQNNEYEYYNIHGNCKQVRCKEHHFQTYDPRKKDQKCVVCGAQMRPHILFFDECYGKDYGAEIKDKTFPLVICIGSSVKTGLAINMIQRAQEIVQINPEPVIEIGKVYPFTEQTDEVLRKIITALNNRITLKQLDNKQSA